MTAGPCVMCAPAQAGAGPRFIAELAVSRAYLNEDQFFPGWVVVVLREHATELYELSRQTRAALMEDVTRVARALAEVYRPRKMNYELLGNQVPHIHWHLIPRLASDPDPRWPVWRLAHDPLPLPPGEAPGRIEAIRRALGAQR